MKRVLLADDEETVRNGLERLIKSIDPSLEVRCVENSEKLVEAAKEEYDLIYADNRMLPGISGLEAVKKIRGDGINTPIFIMFNNNPQEYAELALGAGANGYIDKNDKDFVNKFCAILSEYLK